MNQPDTNMEICLMCVRDRIHSCVARLVHTLHDSFVYVTHSYTLHDHGTFEESFEERSRSVELVRASSSPVTFNSFQIELVQRKTRMDMSVNGEEDECAAHEWTNRTLAVRERSDSILFSIAR